ncbi:hypothetical protein D7Z54_07425 [Salibacterium salarium]|uniref:Uncharacterized protein n=1 Tax=Salibacterium salarium TaxID=284579 RepID=A0A3R9P6N7_9BACI|nr:hypothetical protein D7Z54_07425 [Salibacterium salarium]
MKNKEKILFNLLVFLASLCLLFAFIKQNLVFSLLALTAALGAQYFYRKWHPKKYYSYKDVIKNKENSNVKEK